MILEQLEMQVLNHFAYRVLVGRVLLSIPMDKPKFFTWWYSEDSLNKQVLKYTVHGRLKRVLFASSDLDVKHWISCQVGDEKVFQVSSEGQKRCRLLTLKQNHYFNS